MDSRRLSVVAAFVVSCGGAPRDDDEGATLPITFTTSPSPTEGGSSSTNTGDSSGAEASDTEKLDSPPSQPAVGCEAIDFLFVIDNSESMATYQQALAEQFPAFITAISDAVPLGTNIHVGITTTDFDDGCDAVEATQSCQSTASLTEVQAHYRDPSVDPDGGNGTQGRLFEYAQQRYFELESGDDPAPLTEWFSAAAVAAGESGCSFEMPVAAAGWIADPANDATNAGFLRDARALLVVFVLTDEPDKSVESESVSRQRILDAKPTCGGDACVFTGGLLPTCVPEINQKLWQFLTAFGSDEPPWGDIGATSEYATVFGDALAVAIADACEDVPIP